MNANPTCADLQAPLPPLPLDPAQIKGFLHPDEGAALYHAARAACALGPCLEVGSYCGKSTLYLGYGCRNVGGVLFALDHHRGSEEHQPGEEFHDTELMTDKGVDSFPVLRANLQAAGLLDTVVPVVSTSAVAARGWTGNLGLVFIDGGHSFAAASADYRGWVPHLVAGGLLAIHDIFRNPADGGQAPVTLLRRALGGGDFELLAQVHTLAVLRRRG